MTTALRRYEFSERLADILGESRRDVRFRVTLLISAGVVPPGPRGPGSPPATADYGADLLIGVMAAPQQVHTVEANHCYRALVPAEPIPGVLTPGVVIGVRRGRRAGERLSALLPGLDWLDDRPRFGEALARLLARAHSADARAALAGAVFGVWLNRSIPIAALQLAATDAHSASRRLITQYYELPPGARPPAWLDPERGGTADAGLLHSVFVPTAKLAAIGALVLPPPATANKGDPPMLDLGQTLANLRSLARQNRNRRPWEKLLAKLAEVEAAAESIETTTGGLGEVRDFGANPGNLKMLTYVPDDLQAKPALVVVLHGCTQTATSYDYGTGWSTLADRHGFALLLPEQRRTNNPLRCFNWFRPDDNRRETGEAASIRQMVAHMVATHGVDPARVFVTGLSAGGAMTSVLLAAYPEVFAGGAVLAGVPYGCATGLQEAFDVIFQGKVLPAEEWGAKVRAASAHQGPWPRVAVWHGDADTTVKPVNAEEILKQWGTVHGLPSEPHAEDGVGPHRRRVWRDALGRDVLESWTVAGMAHGAAIDPAGENGCGVAGPFINDVGISSSYHIARSWGLTEQRREVKPRVRVRPKTRPAPEPEARPAREGIAEGIDIPIREVEKEIWVAPGGDAVKVGEILPLERGAAAAEGTSKEQDGGFGARRQRPGSAGFAGGTVGGVDVAAIVSSALQAAGVLRGGDGQPGGRPGTVAGVDIPGIINTALGAAGVLKSGAERSSTAGTGRGGLDIAGIIAQSLEAAGLMRGERAADAPVAPEPAPRPAQAWSGEGWEVQDDPAATAAGGTQLVGQVASGVGGDCGQKQRAITREVRLGSRPVLAYNRKLDLKAQVNMFTTASFTVLVDGEPVDEVSVVGMDYAETAWTERAGIDLARFAGRTVTLSFEVAAKSNAVAEVTAKAWLRGISVRELEVAGA